MMRTANRQTNHGGRCTEPDLFGYGIALPVSTDSIHFAGTENPRYLRALDALLRRAITREQLDRIAGCSNGPALVAALRALGLCKTGLVCTMIEDSDRDGRPVKRGVYSLSEKGRRAVHAWMRHRGET